MANTKIIRLELDGFADDTYDVISFRGAEGISTLFRYNITLASATPTQDFDALLEAKAHLILGDPPMHVRGILCSVQQGYEGAWKTEAGSRTRCDVVLVPEVYKLSLTSRTRIFQEMSVPDIVKKILNEAGIPGGETDWRLQSTHAAKEFVLQYQESDLDFIQRLLDYDGIHYHFEHGDDVGKMVFGDANAAFNTISGESTIRLGIPDPELGTAGVGAWGHEQTITRFQSRQRVVPKKVVLQDYNFQKSSMSLKVEGEIKTPEAAVGVQYFYGEHYNVPAEGNAIRDIRKEEILARKRVFFGSGSVRRFYAGGAYSLTGVDDIDASLADEYLLTEMTCDGSQPVENIGGARGYHYGNEFTCILKPKIEFRPERRTAWPQIAGVVHAKVCAAPGGGQYAHIDDRGRYKVRFLFDIDHSGDDDKASCWLRAIEPYVGKDHGFHAPLLKDVEVLVAFENGDPDRPIIVGCAYNTDFPSPTKNSNHAQTVWRSAALNEVRMDDTSGSEHIYIHAQKDWNNVVENDRTFEIKHDDIQKVKNNREVKVDVDQKTEIGGKCDVKISKDYTEKIDGNKSIEVGGNHTEKITGDFSLSIDGKSDMKYKGDQTVDLSAKSTLTVGADAAETFKAKKTEKISSDSAITIGGKSETKVTGKYSLEVSGETAIESKGDLKIESKGEGGIDCMKGLELSTWGDATLKGLKGVEINGKGGVTIKTSSGVEVEASSDVKIKGSKVDICNGSLTAM